MKKIIIDYKSELSVREKMLLWLLDNVVTVHSIFYPNRKNWNLTTADLVNYPDKTLGKELGLFLEKEKLEPVEKIERHDAFHILFNFSTKLKDEAAMQFFLIANGKISPFTLSTAVFTTLVMPDNWSYFWQQYKRGKQTRSIAKWDFKSLLNENFQDLKSYLNYQPFDNPKLTNRLNLYYNH
jgi:ubiquinone biosynthesis protein Coq4